MLNGKCKKYGHFQQYTTVNVLYILVYLYAVVLLCIFVFM